MQRLILHVFEQSRRLWASLRKAVDSFSLCSWRRLSRRRSPSHSLLAKVLQAVVEHRHRFQVSPISARPCSRLRRLVGSSISIDSPAGQSLFSSSIQWGVWMILKCSRSSWMAIRVDPSHPLILGLHILQELQAHMPGKRRLPHTQAHRLHQRSWNVSGQSIFHAFGFLTAGSTKLRIHRLLPWLSRL